jgi:transcriptional regulator with XRE-family HTH domain
MMIAATTQEFHQKKFPKIVTRNKYSLPINERLKTARNNKGYSVSRVIEELNKMGMKCGQSTIQGYEANENSPHHRYPSLQMILALGHLYECSIDFLFGLTDHLHRPSNDLKEILHEHNLKWENEIITKDSKTKLIKSFNRFLKKK